MNVKVKIRVFSLIIIIMSTMKAARSIFYLKTLQQGQTSPRGP